MLLFVYIVVATQHFTDNIKVERFLYSTWSSCSFVLLNTRLQLHWVTEDTALADLLRQLAMVVGLSLIILSSPLISYEMYPTSLKYWHTRFQSARQFPGKMQGHNLRQQ